MTTARQRWAAKVDRNGPIPIRRRDLGQCWLWTGARQSGGYGRFKVDDKVTLAHRWTYEQERGPIDADMTLDHLCLNPSCVNPAHMEVVTRAENARRGNPQTGKTFCTHGHEFTPENTYVRPGTRRRECRTCKKRLTAESMRRMRARRRKAS